MFTRLAPLLLVALIALPVQAQEPAIDDGTVANDDLHHYAQTWPRLIGGLEGLQQEIRYPEAAKAEGIEGTVLVQFVVDEEGRVTDEKLAEHTETPFEIDAETRREMRQALEESGHVTDEKPPLSTNPELAAEALRVVRQARFEPGTKHGEPVKVTVKLPIQFRL